MGHFQGSTQAIDNNVKKMALTSVVLLRRHCDDFSEQQRAAQTSQKEAEMARKMSDVVVRVVVASIETKSNGREERTKCRCRWCGSP